MKLQTRVVSTRGLALHFTLEHDVSNISILSRTSCLFSWPDRLVPDSADYTLPARCLLSCYCETHMSCVTKRDKREVLRLCRSALEQRSLRNHGCSSVFYHAPPSPLVHGGPVLLPPAPPPPPSPPLLKVCVIGDEVRVHERPSLPDLPPGLTGSFAFDSQKPYPTLEEVSLAEKKTVPSDAPTHAC